MKDKLREAFQAYTSLVQSQLQKRNGESQGEGPLRAIFNNVSKLQGMVIHLEKRPEFRQLVAEANNTFSGDYHLKSNWGWYEAVMNFFRRSGYYVDISQEKAIRADSLFQTFSEAFHKRGNEITYLVPLEFVSFHYTERNMDFGTFSIQRFNSEGLDEMIGNRINRIFYPWTSIDTKKLQPYWFIRLKETIPASKIGTIHVNMDDLYNVKTKYTGYPRALEAALQQLTLFDWQADWWKESPSQEIREPGWQGFSIPFIIIVDHNLLDRPRNAPDTAILETEPVIDAQTGEEIGEGPVTYIHFNQSETETFKAFVQHAGNLWASLRAHENRWPFIEIASGNFVKAFFAEGLDQLLWHITTLEALLGEEGGGITDRLARRISTILGKSQEERKSIKKQFKELYDFRSDLVHGNPFQKAIYIRHLRDARSLARRTLLWFLHYLCIISSGIQGHDTAEGIPTREEILTVLDFDCSSRDRLGQLLKILPSGFPTISEWLDP